MVLCGSVATDTQNTSQLSLLNVVNEINLHLSKPLAKGDAVNVHANIRLATLWRRSDRKKGEKINVRYSWGRKKGLKAPPITATIDLREFVQNQHIANIGGIAFDEPGEYQVTAQIEKSVGGKKRWTTVATLPIDVKIAAVEAEVSAN
jgi:hypothetical protein